MKFHSIVTNIGVKNVLTNYTLLEVNKLYFYVVRT